MNEHILFIPGGGGEGDHKVDAKLVASLREILGEAYVVHYPLLTDDEPSPDFGRSSQIDKKIPSGGHQFNNDLTIVAEDIKPL